MTERHRRVSREAVVDVAIAFAREKGWRVNPDLLSQYVRFRFGGSKWVKMRTVMYWVRDYNRFANLKPMGLRVDDPRFEFEVA